ILKKVGMLLTPVMLWAIMISVAKLALRGEFENPLWTALRYLIQRGFFFQFWFIGSLVIVQLISPLLNYLLRKHFVIFHVIIVISGVVCLIVMSFSYYFHAPLAKAVIQTFRLWTWLFYFMLGAALRRGKYLSKISKNNRLIFFVFTILAVQIAAIFSSVVLKNGYAEYDYDSIYVIFAVIILMLLYSKTIDLKRGRTFSRFIRHFSKNTMGIFVIHTIILKIMLRFAPTSIQSLVPLTIVIIFLASDLLVSCIEKIPFLSRLVSID
ncbi:acyltransferase family protein, partial [Lacticaseibacillus rhamnosus]|uniref:acyltransferase family protein n=1 Tax=Lacticaseibacillus rhamnosus TaxID=47715 RepID=UPI0023E18D2C